MLKMTEKKSHVVTWMLSSRVFIQIHQFSMRRGLKPLYLSDTLSSVIEDPSQRKTIRDLFPNFIMGIVTQGGLGIKGLHGPFFIRAVPGFMALSHVWFLQDKKKTLREEESFTLFTIVFPADFDMYLTPKNKTELTKLIEHWYAEIKHVDELDTKKCKQFEQKIRDWFGRVEETEKLSIAATGGANTLGNSLIQLNATLKSQKLRSRIALWCNGKILEKLLPQVFWFLVERDAYQGVHFEFHEGKVSQLMFPNLEIVFNSSLSPMQSEILADAHVFILLPTKDVSKTLDRILDTIEWKRVTNAFFILDPMKLSTEKYKKKMEKIKNELSSNLKYRFTELPMHLDPSGSLIPYVLSDLLVDVTFELGKKQ